MTSETVLESILSKVKGRIAEDRIQVPEHALRSRVHRIPHDFRSVFLKPTVEGAHRPRVIAEIKYTSPSVKRAGQTFGQTASPFEIASQYLMNGAAALSILTERDFFDGHIHNLEAVRLSQPDAFLLMKDFVVDDYQVLQGLAYGADAILLIMAALGKREAERLFRLAKEMGLTALVEVHDESEMYEALEIGADLIGVNNRDLKSLEISLQTSERLAKIAPESAVLISESGISKSSDIIHLQEMGYRGFLIGSHFMKTQDPGLALKELLEGVS